MDLVQRKRRENPTALGREMAEHLLTKQMGTDALVEACSNPAVAENP
jgi:hypothetical protein